MLELSRWFGSFGERLWELSRGQDDRPVQTSRRRKSLSVEQTYDRDLLSEQEILTKVEPLLAELQKRYQLIEEEYEVCKHIVKVKFADFTQTTLEESRPLNGISLHQHFSDLLRRAWTRGNRPVRLLGLGVRLQDLRNDTLMQQLELFERKFAGLG